MGRVALEGGAERDVGSRERLAAEEGTLSPMKPVKLMYLEM
jgi:hypothetical protein